MRNTGPVPAARVFSNGRYSTLLTSAGGGTSRLGSLAITRWTNDRTRDADGFFLYVRDLETGALWSAGYQPVRAAPERYEATLTNGRARIARDDRGIRTCLDVCVAPDRDIELRRLTLSNPGSRTRRLEVTTYAEVVLNTPAADAAHPAFSKLFVQTGWWAEEQTLLAWRRPRSPEEEPLWLAHRLIGDHGVVAGTGHETDRALFLGRGRDTGSPRAFDAGVDLSGTTGNVLDPILCLRRTVDLPAGSSVQLTVLLAAASSRQGVVALAGGWDETGVDEVMRRPAPDLPVAADPELIADADALNALATAGDVPFASGSSAPSPTRSALHVSAGGAADRANHGEALRLDNGIGGFSADGNEYVMHIAPGAPGGGLPPLPWVNVIANEQAGCIVSERGAGYVWTINSREHRLTPWSNDPVSDPHGDAIYVCDDETGAVWSPTPGPATGSGAYEVRHGFGYTRFLHREGDLAHDTSYFVPRHDMARVVLVRITNHGDGARRLSLAGYTRWVLGGTPVESGRAVVTTRDAGSGAIFAVTSADDDFASRVAVATAWTPGASGETSVTGDRTAFLGRYGTERAPLALAVDAPLDGRTGSGLDPCAAFRTPVVLGPGESVEWSFVIGDAETEDAARALALHYRDPGLARRALQQVRAFWRETLSAVRVETPSPAIDLMVNGWLAYQNLSCRLWGRSAFYQSGGAFGFRDQLQDASALIYHDPSLARAQIVLHAGHQFIEGDVLHWWHPPGGRGLRTRFADDLLWLPYVACFYVRRTGDQSVLDEPARFITARLLEDGEDEALVLPEDSGTRGSVYEHCCASLDRSLTAGAHGLPLMGVGDWNDGMNRVGRLGRGESVWLGFFLYEILDDFIPMSRARGDESRAAGYAAYQSALGAALDAAGWDGAWYRRAYYDDGTPLGSAESDECQIDALAQAWSVMAGVASAARGRRALDAMEARLVSEREGIIRLLTPAFDRTTHDPGYIKGYLPGVRENGGQYTHGALWAVRALAEMGRCGRAAPLLEMLSPVSHTRTPAEAGIYRAEPYVIAADVYGVAPHVGRGGWSWYTGSAGWMIRVALESILGFDLVEGRDVVLRPCIPDSWPGFIIRWRLPGEESMLTVDVRRTGEPGAESTVHVDGRLLQLTGGVVRFPVLRDGASHRVDVVLGAGSHPEYRPSVRPAVTTVAGC